MKTQKIAGLEVEIHLREISEDSKYEWCAYYSVTLKKDGKEMTYFDFEYFEPKIMTEYELFKCFLNEGWMFENATDQFGNSIDSCLLNDFVGQYWIDNMRLIRKLSKC